MILHFLNSRNWEKTMSTPKFVNFPHFWIPGIEKKHVYIPVVPARGGAEVALKIYIRSPTPTGSGVGGVDPIFLIMYEHKGGLTPSLFAKNIWELGGGNPSNWGMYECQMLEMYYW